MQFASTVNCLWLVLIFGKTLYEIRRKKSDKKEFKWCLNKKIQCSDHFGNRIDYYYNSDLAFDGMVQILKP
jgi:hypothetical protein